MNAIVLAGGEGTRLRPLTLATPKPLVPVLGRPLLGHLLSHLDRHGVTRAILSLSRSPSSEVVRAAIEADPSLGADAPLELELSPVFEDAPLGSGGAIAFAAAGLDLANDEPLLVCNADLVTDLDLTVMLEAHRGSGAELTIALTEVGEPSRFGVVALEADGRIGRFVEKPAPGTEPSNLVNAGFWLFQPAVVATLDASGFSRVEDTLFPSMAAGGRRIMGFRHDGYWRDIGTAEAYLEAHLELLDGACPEVGAARAAHLGAGTRLDAAARVQRSSLGRNCDVSAGAEVVDSVLWDGVRVQAGARVQRSVLAGGTVVHAGARLEGVVLADGPEAAAGMAAGA